IRDKLVTGVQTCALPISLESILLVPRHQVEMQVGDALTHAVVDGDEHAVCLQAGLDRALDKLRNAEKRRQQLGREVGQRLNVGRSEERRVGKEGRWGWWP